MPGRSGRRRDRRRVGKSDTQDASATASSISHETDDPPVASAEAKGDSSLDARRPVDRYSNAVISDEQAGALSRWIYSEEVSPAPPSLTPTHGKARARSPDFGVVIYDLETSHDAERGTYHEKGLHECSSSEQIQWKKRSQIIEFAAIDLHSGKRLLSRCRPEFQWEDVISPAARCFAEDHGHDKIIQDESLPQFKECWPTEVLPFLKKAAGSTGRLAMIAHNGDAFDHFVLEKELIRLELGLPSDLNLELHRFDPIRTLKHTFGQDYGSGGQLALKALHAHHVQQRVGEDLAPHQAMNDCIMLAEVLSRWQELGNLLSDEIAGDICKADEASAPAAAAALRVRFACPAHRAVKGVPPPPPPPPLLLSQPPQDAVVTVASPVAGGGALLTLPPPPPTMPPKPPGVPQLRSAAAEFVPGVQWTTPAPVWGLDPSGFASSNYDCGQGRFDPRLGDEGWYCNEKTDAPSWEPVVPPEADLALVASMQYQ